MTPHRVALALVLLLGAALAGPAAAAPPASTRAALIERARTGMGYSYWWGHGAWRTDGASHGSCSGSCPSCSHSGSYGADCSGFAAKVWQVPNTSELSTDAHPYSTYNFRYETTHWSRVSRDDTAQGDSLVYNSNGSGHIVIYESGDPWGSFWAYECKGCSYGCVHNLRTASSSYIAIKRNNLTAAPAEGDLVGVVYAGADANARLPGAAVGLNTGATATARASDGYWTFTLAPGNYTATASLAGYTTRARTCTVAAGTTNWCSIGLTAACTPDCSGRECGPDPSCGQSCGACSGGEVCDASGTCQASCTPDCSGRECGPDPACGTDCGACPAGSVCSAAGQCEACAPECGDRECGPDPACGASCGTCPDGLSCNLLGQCEEFDCVPDCTGRECGPDPVCGQSCALCAADRVCSAAGRCEAIDADSGKLYGYALVLPFGVTDLSRSVHVPHAAIRLESGPETQADADGYFELLVPPGSHTVIASSPGMTAGKQACAVVGGGYTLCLVTLTPVDDVEDGNDGWVQGGCAVVAPLPPLLAAFLLPQLIARRRRPR